LSLRIEDCGLIGDCETAALVGRSGTIDWYSSSSPRSPPHHPAAILLASAGVCFFAIAGLLICAGATRDDGYRFRPRERGLYALPFWISALAFQCKKPAPIGTKANYPGFIKPALASSIERVLRFAASSVSMASACARLVSCSAAYMLPYPNYPHDRQGRQKEAS
jgi:hypothetical protein